MSSDDHAQWPDAFRDAVFDVTKEDHVQQLLADQREIFERLVESNRALGSFNRTSADQYADAVGFINRSTKMLKEMKADLDYTHKHIRSARLLLVKHFPAQSASAATDLLDLTPPADDGDEPPREGDKEQVAKEDVVEEAKNEN